MEKEQNKFENIQSKNDFIKYTQKLSLNFEEDPSSWENLTISDFLESISAYVNDMDPKYIYENHGIIIPENPDWSFIAMILTAGKEYE